ncbi:FecR domain-containing protein [Pseudothauera rhizosphaerae]|uniref:DUF4880 domain-containing protein n=1 Tax=Pseudothauera rhizosphaerae TaxID=2565932 RepID=A0A4S4AL21_9RHOO|nr:FecR domain-containing protein [Pseudothauera rhizosphaerae]THF60148.1 DUF4880 domain-containing protein [Pseudothauera rhizosphaerae]
MNAAIDPALIEEAARWFVLLASGEATADDRTACAGWRTADSRHEAAWQHISAATARVSGIPRQHAQASVAALNATGKDQRPGRRRFLAQLGILCAIGIAARQGWRQSDWSADQRTAIGEQRDLTLADGSLLRLDTDTAIDIDFSASARLIRLRRGRIMVATAPAPSPAATRPPFLVETAEGRVEALGTQFVVRQESDSTQVTVVQARVAIHASLAEGAPPILAAGEAARFGRQGIIAREAARPGSSAWIKGILVADDMPLADFVAELARYRSAPLECAPAVRQWRISGTYPLVDTEGALAAIGRILPVRTQPLHPEDPARGTLVVAR